MQTIEEKENAIVLSIVFLFPKILYFPNRIPITAAKESPIPSIIHPSRYSINLKLIQFAFYFENYLSFKRGREQPIRK